MNKKINKNMASRIVPEQVEEILYTVRDYPELIGKMLCGIGIEHIEEMPKELYRENIERLRRIVSYYKSLPEVN